MISKPIVYEDRSEVDCCSAVVARSWPVLESLAASLMRGSIFSEVKNVKV